MSEIDLIPNDYREMLLRRRYMRLGMLTVSVLMSVSMGVYGALGYVTKNIRADIEPLQKQQAISTQQRNELARLRGNETELKQQWELLNGLRGSGAAETMFEIIDRSLPGNNVWFMSWQVQRVGITVDKLPARVDAGYFIVAPPGETISTPGVWQIQTHMTIKGQAHDHVALSEFVTQLFQQAEVEDVRVVKTALRHDTAPRVVDFDLTVMINSSVEIN